MTRRQIAHKHFPCTCGPMCLSRNKIAEDCSFHHEYWDEAMGEYAKQQATGFFVWAVETYGDKLGGFSPLDQLYDIYQNKTND
jgi:hypothetical protein